MWPFYRRTSKLPRAEERVLILGGSSGVGRELARIYASRGARVCIVARREEELKKVTEEAQQLHAKATKAKAKDVDGDDRVFHVKADFTVIDDMLAVRAKVQEAWEGLDTLVVCAAVLTTRPLYELAGLEMHGRTFTPPQAEKENIEHVVNTARRALEGNFIGPLIAVTTFIPMLAASCAPSVMLMATLGALIPAPSLSLYNSTKAGALMLYQTLAVEHPYIRFTRVLPSVMKGENFFASSIDGGRVRSGDPATFGLENADVAKRAVLGVDRGEEVVFIPGYLGWTSHFVYWLCPPIVVSYVRRMYKYDAA